MFRFFIRKHLVSATCFALLLGIPIETCSEVRGAPYEGLRNEAARMVCQIPPEDRYAVAVMDPVVDRNELQGCIGGPIAETLVQVLQEFQFTLIEMGPLFEGMIDRDLRLNPFEVSKIAQANGVRSIFTGTANIDHGHLRLVYRMIRLEDMQIVGVFSCRLSKEEFPDCFLEGDLTPPTRGIHMDIPAPQRRP